MLGTYQRRMLTAWARSIYSRCGLVRKVPGLHSYLTSGRRCTAPHPRPALRSPSRTIRSRPHRALWCSAAILKQTRVDYLGGEIKLHRLPSCCLARGRLKGQPLTWMKGQCVTILCDQMKALVAPKNGSNHCRCRHESLAIPRSNGRVLKSVTTKGHRLVGIWRDGSFPLCNGHHRTAIPSHQSIVSRKAKGARHRNWFPKPE